ncbi:MAG: ATP-binding cassette domain-containing protein [Rhodothermaceae bacterium]|nr:ATP-binding cassette domain-containing protein [Rhodothermaceae bacterium]
MRFGRRVLFRELALTVQPGESLAITGANGSGKSTLLKVLAGVLTPVAGAVQLVVEGEAVAEEERPLHVGFVAPYLQLYDPFSARENLLFLAKARRLSGAEARIHDVLDRVGLAKRTEDLLGTFSTGMRQRLRIAAALLHDPPLLLLDEPAATLDAAGRALVEEIIALPDKLVVVATNDPDEAALCAHALSLDATAEARTAG